MFGLIKQKTNKLNSVDVSWIFCFQGPDGDNGKDGLPGAPGLPGADVSEAAR